MPKNLTGGNFPARWEAEVILRLWPSCLFTEHKRIINVLRLVPSGSRIPLMYDLPKIHRESVPMCSLLGPSLANIFMSTAEVTWLDECPLSFELVYYRRYIDDTLVFFRRPDHVKRFLDYLNSKQKNTFLTAETEKRGTLPFLNLLLSRDAFIEAAEIRKPTFTGLLSHFHSFISDSYKRNLATNLFSRDYRVCSSHNVVQLECE